MEAIADLLAGWIAGLQACVDGLAWGESVAIVGGCVLCIFGLSWLLESTERKSHSLSSQLTLLATKFARAALIFVTLYVLTAGVFREALPLVFLIVLLAIAIAAAINDTRPKGKGLRGLRS